MTDLATGMPGRLAIVLDGQLESAPTVKERIGGGSAVITGNFSFREAKMLSDILNNPLKVSLTIGEQYEVSPTLAAGALSSSINACLLGAVLVIAFMIVWYKSGGVAVLSVSLKCASCSGCTFRNFSGYFYPPRHGCTGIDNWYGSGCKYPNFRKNREELKAGKSSENALTGGYSKAFSTIIDANLTTLITASILIWLGTGPVKGFGITLAIGIATSVFCALFVSRLFLSLCLNQELTISSVFKKSKNPNPQNPLISSGTGKLLFLHPGSLWASAFFHLFQERYHSRH